MKTGFAIAITSLLFLFTGCEETCPDSLVHECHEVPDNNGCDGEYTRWFYDEAAGECKKISYIGCEEKGFESLPSCMECECVPEDHCI